MAGLLPTERDIAGSRVFKGRVLRVPLLIPATFAALVALIPGVAHATPKCDGKRATIVGTPGRDVIKAPRGLQVIYAGAGNDRILASAGRQVICGGDGNDVIRSGSTKDLLLGGPGRDAVDAGGGSDGIRGGAGGDLILAGPGQDVARGGGGRDRIYGSHQDDFLFGQAGGDVVVGGQGVDLLRGDAGNDLLRGDENTDRYLGGPGIDSASFAAATPGIGGKGEGVEVLLQSGRIYGDGGSEDIRDVESIVGSAFSDKIGGTTTSAARGSARGIAGTDSCFPFATVDCGPYSFSTDDPIALVDQSKADPGVLVLGAAAADRLEIAPRGRSGVTISGPTPLAAGPGCQTDGPRVVCSASGRYLGHLTVYGDEGDDRISIAGRFAAATAVKIDGGPGSDLLRGGAGDDLLYAGQDGHDVLAGRAGDDVLFAGLGSDVLRGGAGEDQLSMDAACQGNRYSGGGGGPDIVTFALTGGISARIGGGARYIRGGPCTPDRIRSDVEILEGSASRDVLVGDSGDNGLILGLEGDDLLRGLGGRDRLRGGPGNDMMLGGPGPDILQARDGTRDLRIDCGPGGRTATVDKRDPKPRRC